jgi:small subunit ribosomal protein S17
MADEETPETPEETEPEAPEPEAAEEATEPEAEAPEEAAEAEAEQPEEPRAPDHPKERKRRAKVAKAAARPARAPMSPEERHAERLEDRRRKRELRRRGRLRAREKARARKGEVRETPPREHAPGKPKTRQGVVVSNRAAKTITVRIDTTGRHRRYEKIVRTSRTVHAHDERDEAGIGDTVIVRESRPLSRTKRWRLIRVVEKAE